MRARVRVAGDREEREDRRGLARVDRQRRSVDVDARRSDVTWDIGERVRLPDDRVALIVAGLLFAALKYYRIG